MRRFCLLLFLLSSLLSFASKYTNEMYAKVAKPDTVVIQIHDTIVVRDTIIVKDTVFVKDTLFVKDVATSAAPVTSAAAVATTATATTVAAIAPATAEKSYRDEDGNALTKQYHVVLGVFQSKLNAQNLVDNIMQKGEGSPSISIGPDGLYRVFFYSSDVESEARSMLSQAKDDFPSAWLLNIKK